jgi:hypothetical protein
MAEALMTWEFIDKKQKENQHGSEGGDNREVLLYPY